MFVRLLFWLVRGHPSTTCISSCACASSAHYVINVERVKLQAKIIVRSNVLSGWGGKRNYHEIALSLYQDSQLDLWCSEEGAKQQMYLLLSPDPLQVSRWIQKGRQRYVPRPPTIPPLFEFYFCNPSVARFVKSTIVAMKPKS